MCVPLLEYLTIKENCLVNMKYKKRRLEKEAERCIKTNDDFENPASIPLIKENTKSSQLDNDKQMDEVSKSIGTDNTFTPSSLDESFEKNDINVTHTGSVLQTSSTDTAL